MDILLKHGSRMNIMDADAACVLAVLDVQEKCQHLVKEEFKQFSPLTFKKKTLADAVVDYFVKVQVDVDRYIHVRVREHPDGLRTLVSVERNKSESDEIKTVTYSE